MPVDKKFLKKKEPLILLSQDIAEEIASISLMPWTVIQQYSPAFMHYGGKTIVEGILSEDEMVEISTCSNYEDVFKRDKSIDISDIPPMDIVKGNFDIPDGTDYIIAPDLIGSSFLLQYISEEYVLTKEASRLIKTNSGRIMWIRKDIYKNLYNEYRKDILQTNWRQEAIREENIRSIADVLRALLLRKDFPQLPINS